MKELKKFLKKKSKVKNTPNSNNKNLEKISEFLLYTISLGKRIFHRFNPREKYFVALAILVIASSLVAVGAQLYASKTETIPAIGGEYREAVVGRPRFINPVLSTTNDVDRDIVQLIYSSLMKYDKDGNLTEDLAKSFEILDEGKTYKFILKKNAVWEDGNPLTAADVIFTINLIQNPQYASPLFQSWQGVEVSSDDSGIIIFKLASAYPPFLENLTLGIMPKHIWEDVSPENFALTEFNLQPIASGKFKAEKFTKDNSGFISSYTLQKNENYYAQKPFLNKITFKFYGSEEDAINALNNKSVDGIAFIVPRDIELLEDALSLNIHEFEMPRYFAIFINENKNKTLSDLSVRKALNFGTNRKHLIDSVLLGFGQITDSAIPPNLTNYYNSEIKGAKYDPEQAKSLLKEAGWEDIDGDGILELKTDTSEDGEEESNKEIVKLKLTLSTAQRPELEYAANIIKQQWREIGVDVEIRTQDLGDLQQNYIRNRDYELLLFGEILGSIPDPFSFWHSSQKNNPGLNLSNYENDDVDSLLESARQESDEEKRIEYYMELQKKIAEDVPAIFLYNPLYLYPISKSVQGVEPAFITDGAYRFIDVSNWYIETKRIL